jgi:uncharacterized membrane protein YhaH (DUF805 family)
VQLSAYTLHHGRVARATWLYRTALVMAVCAGLGSLGQMFFGDTGALPFAALFVWCGGAIMIQRLHDLGLSGWWLLLLLVPVAGPLWLFIQPWRRGAEGRNRFGEQPLSRKDYLQVDIAR